jgi:hypothetical protein
MKSCKISFLLDTNTNTICEHITILFCEIGIMLTKYNSYNCVMSNNLNYKSDKIY